ncbi:MAG: AAA family ATPase [Methanosarcinaceae archaeon]|nr:AAA family ATPase [Methanosarcinaceae archaeon]
MNHEKILRISLTGTPGCGKSSVSNFIKKSELSDICILNLTEFVKERNISSIYDSKRDCLVVDTDALDVEVSNFEIELQKSAESGSAISDFAASDSDLDSNSDSELSSPLVLLLDSHFSHLLCDISIVLRADPEVLYSRLSERNYSVEKIEENCEAELLDVILCEALDLCNCVFEINTTNKSVSDVSKSVLYTIDLISKNPDAFLSKNTSVYDSPFFPKQYLPGSINWLGEYYDAL